MKKKLFLILTGVLLIMVSVFSLTGCDSIFGNISMPKHPVEYLKKWMESDKKLLVEDRYDYMVELSTDGVIMQYYTWDKYRNTVDETYEEIVGDNVVVYYIRYDNKYNKIIEKRKSSVPITEAKEHLKINDDSKIIYEIFNTTIRLKYKDEVDFERFKDEFDEIFTKTEYGYRGREGTGLEEILFSVTYDGLVISENYNVLFAFSLFEDNYKMSIPEGYKNIEDNAN